jgi:hypothetical protein
MQFTRWSSLPLLLALALAPPAATSQQLTVANAALHQYDGGPAIPASFEFFPGDTAFLTFRVSGFQTIREDDEEHFHLAYTIDAADPEGIPIKETDEGAIESELSRQDKKQNWMPLVRYDVLVPPSAPSGEFRIVIAVEDRIANAKAEQEVIFRVRGRSIEPSESLVLRNFNFYRTETSMRALERAAYKPGSSVWARFDITGYEFGEGNKFSIEYGLKVLRASGKTLFEQPVAAAEERESFYPERSIQGGFSLNLTEDLTAGDYTIIVTVRDKIGEQEFDITRILTVE